MVKLLTYKFKFKCKGNQWIVISAHHPIACIDLCAATATVQLIFCPCS